jgi:hypothetical protein
LRAESGPIFNFYMGKNTAGAQRLHHGQAGGAGGGINFFACRRDADFKRNVTKKVHWNFNPLPPIFRIDPGGAGRERTPALSAAF